MTRPLLQRSLVFWAGIFSIAFLGWAWWQSWHKVGRLWSGDWRYDYGNGGALVAWSSGHSGATGVEYVNQDSPRFGYTARDVLWPQGYRGKNLDIGAFLREKYREDPTLALSARLELYVVNQSPDAWMLYLPFPFLLLLTLLLWLAALAWRARRIRKLERGLVMDA